MNRNKTTQNILRLTETRYIVAGAVMFMIRLLDTVNKMAEMKNIKTIIHFLEFFTDNAHRQDLEQYMYGMYDGIEFEKCGKGKREYKPTRVIPFKSSKPINPYEFMSEEEQRYRSLCRVLLEVLENAASAISMISGKDTEEVLNQLINNVNSKTKPHDWKVGL